MAKYSFMWFDSIRETAPPDGFQCYLGAAPWHRHVKLKVLSNAALASSKIPEEDSETTGLIGYPEGTMTAASPIIEEQLHRKEYGTWRQIERGILFAGRPLATREP
ncbi:uncharacterized protein PG986_012247 [Apiospora aurea]|uniref:Uncharacterized protein n=1 Tax=Apiospora aurea TaxID=335848 RepID=A0ABR1PZV4_9PEZI